MKAKINNLNISCLFFLSLFSCTLGIAPYIIIKYNNINAYISIFLGIFFGIIPFIILLYLFNYESDKTIYEKTKIVFGKVFGTIVNILLIISYLLVAVTILFNISNFIISQYLTNTPIILVIIIFSLTSLYASSKGTTTITKISLIYTIIVITLFFLGIIGLAPEIEINNLKPFLEFGIKKPLLGAFIYTLTLTTPVNAILLIPKNNIENNNKTNKYLIITYIISTIIIALTSFVTCSVLGKYLLEIYQYPTYITLKRISIFGFIDRIENFLSFQWILSAFIILSLTINAINNYTKKGKNILFNFSTIIIIIFTTIMLFKNNTNFNHYLDSYYPYILLFTECIYFIIFITIIIKKVYKKNI